MDKWLTLDQAANKLKLHVHDLVDLAIDGKITFHWSPSGFEDTGIDIAQIELTTMKDLDGEKYEGWKRVKDSKVIRGEFGPFLIDLTIDDRWSLILDAIKNKFNFRDDGLFGDDDNLRFIYSDHIYKAYFDDPLKVYLPQASEFNVRLGEMDRYQKQQSSGKSTVKLYKNTQANRVFKLALEKLDLSSINNENGKDGIPKAVWLVVQNTKDVNGGYLFAKNGEGGPERRIFDQYWKKRER